MIVCQPWLKRQAHTAFLFGLLVQPALAQTGSLPTPVVWILVLVLIAMSGLFSGLTLGLLGLDKMGLLIVMGGGEPDRAKNARKILPLRRDGNLLLCTLLLGNVAVNALLSILLANIFDSVIGFLVSTAVIVIFGEIIPQAACSRFALTVGARAVPLVMVIQFFLYPLAKPIALCLDHVLGEELGTIFSTEELKEMVTLHVRNNAMDEETGQAITGALQYRNMRADEVMTPLDHVYMLSVDDTLSYQTMANIFKAGFSRIPVYKETKQNIVGLLYTKDLIFMDPASQTPISSFTNAFGRPIIKVKAWTQLGDCMKAFRGGRSHMALVVDIVEDEGGSDPMYKLVGILTLEDIIEEILGEEIVDEYDAWHDNRQSQEVVRDKRDEEARMRLMHWRSMKLEDHLAASDQLEESKRMFRMDSLNSDGGSPAENSRKIVKPK